MKTLLTKKMLCLSVFLLPTVLLHTAVFAQQTQRVAVTGNVISGETKMPLNGATVQVKGSKRGITTDSLGHFSMRVNAGQTIVISFVGFEPQEFKIDKSQNLNVSLVMRVNDNEEVVVIGYGTRRKSHLTGSVAKVTNDNLQQIPVSRADLALQGKLAGVNIVTTDAQPGAAPTIQIRGNTSITAGSDPLIVIDGYPVPTDLSSIDMNDVESIEVLKDAASAAIYGSRGGNGVILITTKSGKPGKGKISVNYITGFKSVYRKIPYPSLTEWEAFIRADNKGDLPMTLATGAPGPGVYINDAKKFDANTDIQDIVFRDVNYNSLQLSFSGATQNFKYYMSGTASLDDGVMMGNDYKRYNARAGFEAKVSPKVTVSFSVNPSYTEFYRAPTSLHEAFRQSPPWLPMVHNDTTAKYTGKPVGSFANVRDFDPGRNPNYIGTVNLSSATTNNFWTQLSGTEDKRTQIRNITNMAVKYDFNKNLSFRTSFGYFTGTNEREYFRKSFVASDPYLDGEARARASARGIYENAKTTDLLSENILSFKKAFNRHDVDFIIGGSAQYTYVHSQNIAGSNYATDNISTINAASKIDQASTSITERVLLSALSRINYAFDNKYLFSVSARYDASSRFAPDKRWGFFPSVSAGWVITKEKFFPENNVLTNAKLRASYGVTGNENIPNYRYFASVVDGNAALGTDVTPGFQLQGWSNPELAWETTHSTDLGLDLSFFNSKLNITLDYYQTRTKELLLDLPVYSASGFLTYPINRGKIENNGFEVEVSAPVFNNKDFKWNISGNIYFNKNKLVDFGGAQQFITQGDPSRPNFYISTLGSPVTQYYGWIIDSIVPLTGTTYWPINLHSDRSFVRDVNGDGKITDDDRVVLGNPYPDYNWGFTTNLQYKSFDLSVTIQGSHGAEVFNIDPYYYEHQLGTQGSTAYQFQNYTTEQVAMLRQNWQTNYNIQDASFIALRNVNIGYNFSKTLMKKWGLSSVRIYMTAANLWYQMADSYTSFNPEGDNGFSNDPFRKGYQRGSAPVTRNVSFGINLTF